MTHSLFDEFFNSQIFMGNEKFPKANVSANEKGASIEMAIPFRGKDDISVEIDTKRRVVTVSSDAVADMENYQVKEIPTQAFERRFIISQTFELEPKVKLVNGILTLEFKPTKEQENRFKRVQING